MSFDRSAAEHRQSGAFILEARTEHRPSRGLTLEAGGARRPYGRVDSRDRREPSTVERVDAQGGRGASTVRTSRLSRPAGSIDRGAHCLSRRAGTIDRRSGSRSIQAASIDRRRGKPLETVRGHRQPTGLHLETSRRELDAAARNLMAFRGNRQADARNLDATATPLEAGRFALPAARAARRICPSSRENPRRKLLAAGWTLTSPPNPAMAVRPTRVSGWGELDRPRPALRALPRDRTATACAPHPTRQNLDAAGRECGRRGTFSRSSNGRKTALAGPGDHLTVERASPFIDPARADDDPAAHIGFRARNIRSPSTAAFAARRRGEAPRRLDRENLAELRRDYLAIVKALKRVRDGNGSATDRADAGRLLARMGSEKGPWSAMVPATLGSRCARRPNDAARFAPRSPTRTSFRSIATGGP